MIDITHIKEEDLFDSRDKEFRDHNATYDSQYNNNFKRLDEKVCDERTKEPSWEAVPYGGNKKHRQW